MSSPSLTSTTTAVSDHDSSSFSSSGTTNDDKDNRSSTITNLYPSIPTVDIDPIGIYKYILIRLSKAPDERYLVRGYTWASYHDDIFQFSKQEILQQTNMDKDTIISCAGGGRIQRTNRNNSNPTSSDKKVSSDIDLPSSATIVTVGNSNKNKNNSQSSSSSKDEDEILVYGYSVGYGRADHKCTTQLLLKEFPLAKISYSNDGYW